MQTFLSDLRFGIRMLLKSQRASGLVVIVLSLGIGLSALMFSLIDGAVMTQLPVEGGDRIVRIRRVDRLAETVDDYGTWAARQRSFEALGVVAMNTVTLAADGASAEPVMAAAITPSVLSLLSAQPVLGRSFTEQDAAPGAPAVVVVSHHVWRERLGADPRVVGRIVRVSGRPSEIIGVMPEGFGFPWDQQVWTPLNVDPVQNRAVVKTRPDDWEVVGRLRPGVSMDAGSRELTAITSELDQQQRGTADAASTVRVSAYTDIMSEPGGSAALSALMLGIAFLVLLVACSNVATVLLARAVTRRRELAIRLAMGASRRRITTQLLVETSLLAAGGAACGILVALVGTRAIMSAMPPDMPYWIDLRVNWAMIGFVAITAVLAALMAGLMPALQAARVNTNDVLKEDSRGSSSFRLGQVMRRLVGVEIALSCVLLVVTGLFVRSASKVYDFDFAFEPNEVYTAQLRFPDATFADAAPRVRFTESLQETLGTLPPVDGVAFSTAVPGIGSAEELPVEKEAEQSSATQAARARSIVVSPGYFGLFRSALVGGRGFDTRDRAGANAVAIVNESFAKTHFPDGAIDQRIRQAGPDGKSEWLTIVGVTRDLMEGGLDRVTPETIYLPLAQRAPSELTVIVRPRATFDALPGPIRDAVIALDGDVALYRVLRLDADIDDANSQYKWLSILFAVSGGIALVLAALGLSGVMAFWVTQRMREIGIRMAIGGQRGDIARLVLRQALTQTSMGFGAGVLLAVIAAQLLRSALFGVAPYDPIVFASVLGVLLAGVMLGCWLPVRRATRIDPLKALAAE